MADYARGEFLRELRDRTHNSREFVAAEIGVTAKTLYTWEHGGRIKWDNAKKLARYYDVDPEALVSRNDPDTPEPVSNLSGVEDDDIRGELAAIRQQNDQILRLLADVILSPDEADAVAASAAEREAEIAAAKSASDEQSHRRRRATDPAPSSSPSRSRQPGRRSEPDE